MQILVQNPVNKFFMDDDCQWNPSTTQGHDFESIEEAVSFCAENQLDEYQLLLKFHAPDFELTLSRADAARLTDCYYAAGRNTWN